ncbi:ABC transporter permease [Salipaludibacillus sp. LMS25]|jgi:ABC-2 type transport system permease protein|uniref:ABC transporter permease n=1 Tax=Salipaludibacillus sp. LMS25 TaxID=2924031 RepID=UPI0020D1F247|nr:ABC transporter permease [Salipaludibacillus sp. LMS25]UTR13153.1 ABC transporter permease [Salipaludibacillus sp. LMS25]
MIAIFLLQWKRLWREPVWVLSMVGLTALFVFLLAGRVGDATMTVTTFSTSSLPEETREEWDDKLNESNVFVFDWVEEDEAKEALAKGNVEFALQIGEDDYRIVKVAENLNYHMVEQHVHRVFAEEMRLQEAEEQVTHDTFREEVADYLEEPVLHLVTSSHLGEGDQFAQADRLQVLFGMTLFFSIYTILFSLMNVAEEKRSGTWDRLILSPLKKWQMYIGNLLFSFVIGYAQIIILFLFFQMTLDFGFNGQFGVIAVISACFVFAIVAFGVLLIGIVRSPQQLQVAIPLVAVSMAMLGGAFWPLEIITNDIILTITKAVPLTYGMEALHEAVLNHLGVMDLAQPLAMLLLFGVVFMGVGANLMERR